MACYNSNLCAERTFELRHGEFDVGVERRFGLGRPGPRRGMGRASEFFNLSYGPSFRDATPGDVELHGGVVEFQQGAGMTGGQLFRSHEVADFHGKLQQSYGIGYRSPLLAGLLADLVVTKSEFGSHALEGEGQLDGVQVFALNVFDDGEFEHLFVAGG